MKVVFDPKNVLVAKLNSQLIVSAGTPSHTGGRGRRCPGAAGHGRLGELSILSQLQAPGLWYARRGFKAVKVSPTLHIHLSFIHGFS